MIPDDQTQAAIPPAGTAIAQPTDQTAPDAAGTTGQSSTEKVKNAIDAMLASKGPAVQAFVGPLLTALNLPEEASVLDQLLLEGATFILGLRSDGAAEYAVYPVSTAGAPAPTQPAAPEVPAAVAHAVANVQQAVTELTEALAAAAPAPSA